MSKMSWGVKYNDRVGKTGITAEGTTYITAMMNTVHTINSGGITTVPSAGKVATADLYVAGTKIGNGTNGKLCATNFNIITAIVDASGYKVFTESGSWTCPALNNGDELYVWVVGGGGGGGGCYELVNYPYSHWGGGGGGGGYAKKYILTVGTDINPGDSVAVTIGSGGNYGYGNRDSSSIDTVTSGTAGGPSDFFTSTHHYAGGGGGGEKAYQGSGANGGSGGGQGSQGQGNNSGGTDGNDARYGGYGQRTHPGPNEETGSTTSVSKTDPSQTEAYSAGGEGGSNHGTGASGAANTGNGGGGGGSDAYGGMRGGNGGSGVVVVTW